MSVVYRLAAVSALIATLTGCGFHLRGQGEGAGTATAQLPALQILGLGEYPKFARVLERTLAGRGFTPTDGAAPLRLQIEALTLHEEPLSFNPRLEVAEYRIVQRLRYRLLQGDNDRQRTFNELTAEEAYQAEPQRPAADREQRRQAIQQLHQDLAAQLATQLSQFCTRQVNRCAP